MDRHKIFRTKTYSPECLRKKKFILSLREPVAREVSWFHHYYSNCLKNRPELFCPDHLGGPNFHVTFHDYVARLDLSHSSKFLLAKP